MNLTITNPHDIPAYIVIKTGKPHWKSTNKALITIQPKACLVFDLSKRGAYPQNFDNLMIRFGEDGQLEPLKKYIKLKK